MSLTGIFSNKKHPYNRFILREYFKFDEKPSQEDFVKTKFEQGFFYKLDLNNIDFYIENDKDIHFKSFFGEIYYSYDLYFLFPDKKSYLYYLMKFE